MYSDSEEYSSDSEEYSSEIYGCDESSSFEKINELRQLSLEQIDIEFNENKGSLIHSLNNDLYKCFLQKVELLDFPFAKIEIDIRVLKSLNNNSDCEVIVIWHIGRLHITVEGVNLNNLLPILRESTSPEGFLLATVTANGMKWSDEDYSRPQSRMRKETFKAIKRRECSFTIIPTKAKKLRLIRGIIPIDEKIDKIKFLGTKELDINQPFKIEMLKRWVQTNKGIISLNEYYTK